MHERAKPQKIEELKQLVLSLQQSMVEGFQGTQKQIAGLKNQSWHIERQIREVSEQTAANRAGTFALKSDVAEMYNLLSTLTARLKRVESSR